jgi:hypothetical protein
LGLWLHTQRHPRGDVLVVSVLRDDGEPVDFRNVRLVTEVTRDRRDRAGNGPVVSCPTMFDEHGHARLPIPSEPSPSRLHLAPPPPPVTSHASQEARIEDAEVVSPAREVAAATAPTSAPAVEMLGRGTCLWVEVAPQEGTVAFVESELREYAGAVLRIPAQIETSAGRVSLWAPLWWSEVHGACRAELVVHPNELDAGASLPDPVPLSRLGEDDRESLRISISRAREWSRNAWRELAKRPDLAPDVRALLSEVFGPASR